MHNTSEKDKYSKHVYIAEGQWCNQYHFFNAVAQAQNCRHKNKSVRDQSITQFSLMQRMPNSSLHQTPCWRTNNPTSIRPLTFSSKSSIQAFFNSAEKSQIPPLKQSPLQFLAQQQLWASPENCCRFGPFPEMLWVALLILVVWSNNQVQATLLHAIFARRWHRSQNCSLSRIVTGVPGRSAIQKPIEAEPALAVAVAQSFRGTLRYFLRVVSPCQGRPSCDCNAFDEFGGRNRAQSHSPGSPDTA